MSAHPVTVAEVGEHALVERITARFAVSDRGEVGPGDDAAVIRPPGDPLVYTTDLMVEGVDFDLSYCSGADVGWKAVAINASDCAAMGARPTHALATLALPGSTLVSVVDRIVDGIVQASQRWGVRVVGGDISSARELSLGLAMLGSPYDQVVRRDGARAGDAICVTGSLGGSAGGLICLQRGIADRDGAPHGAVAPSLSASLRTLVGRHLRPQARVTEAEAILAYRPTAMIDVSDGLAVDLHRLMAASAAGCEIDESAIPIDEHLGALAEAIEGVDVLELAILGGEDLELLFTVPEDASEDLVAAELAACIGTVTHDGCRIGQRDLSEWRQQGWEHLRDR